MPSSPAPLAHRCAATGLDRLSAQAPGLSSRDERLHPNTCARGAQDGPDPGHGSSSSGNPQRMGSAARRLRRWDSVAGKAVRRGCLRGRADGGDRDVQADDGREDEPSRRKTISTMLRSSAGASPCPRGHGRKQVQERHGSRRFRPAVAGCSRVSRSSDQALWSALRLMRVLLRASQPEPMRSLELRCRPSDRPSNNVAAETHWWYPAPAAR